MDWMLSNWEWVIIAIMVVDKIVAMTPTKHDDMIWTAIKAGLKKMFPGKSLK